VLYESTALPLSYVGKESRGRALPATQGTVLLAYDSETGLTRPGGPAMRRKLPLEPAKPEKNPVTPNLSVTGPLKGDTTASITYVGFILPKGKQNRDNSAALIVEPDTARGCFPGQRLIPGRP
jgi:hypothetical protein